MAAPAKAEASFTRNEIIALIISLGLSAVGFLRFPELMSVTAVGAAATLIILAGRDHRRNTPKGPSIDTTF